MYDYGVEFYDYVILCVVCMRTLLFAHFVDIYIYELNKWIQVKIYDFNNNKENISRISSTVCYSNLLLIFVYLLRVLALDVTWCKWYGYKLSLIFCLLWWAKLAKLVGRVLTKNVYILLVCNIGEEKGWHGFMDGILILRPIDVDKLRLQTEAVHSYKARSCL